MSPPPLVSDKENFDFQKLIPRKSCGSLMCSGLSRSTAGQHSCSLHCLPLVPSLSWMAKSGYPKLLLKKCLNNLKIQGEKIIRSRSDLGLGFSPLTFALFFKKKMFGAFLKNSNNTFLCEGKSLGI